MLKGQHHSYFHSEEELEVDVFELFTFYNEYFFEGVLAKCVVKWSKRMTLCAGTCKYEGLGSSTITLSQPLLQFRSSNEIKETLLHEMIHAYLFITNPDSCKTEEGHGPAFQKIMHDINAKTRLKLTIYHNFHDEVELYRRHVWRCTGKCKDQAPYYGYVRRAKNREPQKADHWFARHQKSCGGTFVKIMSPEVGNKKESKKPKRKSKEKKEDPKDYGGMTIQDYVDLYAKEDESSQNRINEPKNKKVPKKQEQKGPSTHPPREKVQEKVIIHQEDKPATSNKPAEPVVDHQLHAFLDFLDDQP